MDSLFDSPNSQYLKGSEVLFVSAAAPMDVDRAAINSVMEKVRHTLFRLTPSMHSLIFFVFCVTLYNFQNSHATIFV